MQNSGPTLFSASESIRSSTCDYFILGFALWTVASHITVFLGGTLLDLLLIFAAAVLLLFTGAWFRRKRPKRAPSAPYTASIEPRESKEQRMQNVLLWVLVVVAVCLTLVAHRPDADDTRYVNRALAAADAPKNPILQHDTRHSIPGVPLRVTSKLIANEMLAGALSWATRLPAIYIFHLVFPPLAAMLTILAFGELFRILAPKYWAYGVLAVVVFLFADGAVHRTFGNFSFVRLHQGKGVLVSIIVPLIIVYGLRFVSRPTVRNWLLLAGAQIAGLGMNATGLMVAPAVALLAVLTGALGMNPAAGVKRAALGFTASAYILGVGLYTKLWLLRYLAYVVQQPGPMRALSSVQQQQASFFERNIAYVFGDGRFALVCLVILLTAWFWSETRVARRLCLIFPAAVGLLFANPLVDDVVMKYITGRDVYWRVFWLLPLPAMAGIARCLRHSLHGNSVCALGRCDMACFSCCSGSCWGVASEQSIFSKQNYVRIGIPGLKVTPEYQIARAINDSVDDRPNVLVPEAVSIWLTTIHSHPYPLVSRFRYKSKLGRQRQERVMLTNYIMGRKRPDNAPQALHKGIENYRIGAVCFAQSNRWADEIRQVLGEAGFEKRRLLLSHEIWLPEKRRG